MATGRGRKVFKEKMTIPKHHLEGSNEERMSMSEKVVGPASYFPSIERKYGQPMQFWFDQLTSVADLKHMEQVNWLKSNHGMGHGHANAIVAYVRALPP
jgi:hypothetical protein